MPNKSLLSRHDLKRLWCVEAVPLGMMVGGILCFATWVGSRHLRLNSDVAIAKTDRYQFAVTEPHNALRTRSKVLNEVAGLCNSNTPFDGKDILRESQ